MHSFSGEFSSHHVAANILLDLPVKRSSVFNYLAKEEFLDIEVKKTFVHFTTINQKDTCPFAQSNGCSVVVIVFFRIVEFCVSYFRWWIHWYLV